MLLVCDIGNTNIVFGIFKNDLLTFQFRISTRINRSSDEYGVILLTLLREFDISRDNIDDVIIASVVPPLTFHIENSFRKYFQIEPISINSDFDLGIINKYDLPSQVGLDRLVNAVAGFTKYKKALILIDLGTATTLDVISSKGEYLGGVIIPGITISKEALANNASKLPKVDIQVPPSVVGKNTDHSIQSGLTYGYASMIDGLITKISKEYKDESFRVIATGGLATIIYNISENIDELDKDLTLNGLNIIYKRNKIKQ